MQYKNLILSTSLLVAVLLTSCSNDQILEDVAETPYAVVNNGNQGSEDFLGKLPNTGEWASLSTSGTNDWRDFDDFYRKKLTLDTDKHYFNNLQWTCIAQMVKYTNFTQDATPETQQYYLDQILSRNYVNEPEVVALLLNEVKPDIGQKKVASIARRVFELNKDHLSAENWKKHQQSHNPAYRELAEYGYTRWGEPK